MTNRPPIGFRVAFTAIGGIFIGVGFIFGAWPLLPFGALGLIGGGLESRIHADKANRSLTIRNLSWGFPVYIRTLKVPANSCIIGIMHPAGSQGGDGISLCDSASLYLQAPPRQRTMLAADANAAALISSGRALATVLNIDFEYETGA